MKIVDMKVDRESAEEKAEAAMPVENPYPGGLCLYLCEDELEKLGLKEPLSVGTKCNIEARGVVVGTSDNESIGGRDVSMRIQITALGLSPTEKSAAHKLYGDDGEDGGY